MALDCVNSFRDVNRYPIDLMKQHDKGVEVFVTYNKVWNDAFGARGWKLNATVGDPEIIASTRQTGQQINTSVFVHDILDHFLSGFGVSGHRSEAMALIQLAQRTGSDPRPDFEQMIYEDIMNGRVNGETMQTFLPHRLLDILPPGKALSDRDMVEYLTDAIGKKSLVQTLVDHFFLLGSKGKNHAIESWSKLGLVNENAANTGMAVQSLLEKADYEAESSGVDRLDASIIISKKNCVLIATSGKPEYPRAVYHAEITT